MFRLLFISLGILFFLFSHSSVLAGETVVLSNGDWPPYLSESFRHDGVGSRVVSEAFALEGVDVQFQFMPWKRGYESAYVGKIDGALGWRSTPEREELFYVSDPLFEVETVLFHRQGSRFDWETLDDIGGMSIGVTLGYVAADILKPVVKRNGGKLEIAPTDVNNFQKLIAGRIDVFPCSKAVGYYLLRTRFLPGTADTIDHHSHLFLTKGIHILFSRKTESGRRLVSQFNSGLKKLKESGRYDQYFEESIRGEYLPK